MYKYTPYGVLNGLSLMALGVGLTFFPEFIQFVESALAPLASEGKSTEPLDLAFPVALVNLIRMLGPIAVLLGGFRVLSAILNGARYAGTPAPATYKTLGSRVAEANEKAKAESEAKAWKAEAEAADAAAVRSRVTQSSKANSAENPVAQAYSSVKTDAERLAERWDRARVRHLEVKDAYAAIITDPLNALTHSVLFDVNDARTEAFILAYAKADELFDYHDTKDRTPVLVEEYESAVLLLPSRWDDALRYAEKVGAGWLPEADAKLVATATNLIQLARNTSSEAEARLSWRRAKKNVEQIRAFHLPMEAVDVLEQRVRGQLTPATA